MDIGSVIPRRVAAPYFEPIGLGADQSLSKNQRSKEEPTSWAGIAGEQELRQKEPRQREPRLTRPPRQWNQKAMRTKANDPEGNGTDPSHSHQVSTLFCNLVDRQRCSRLTAIRLNSSPGVHSGGIEEPEVQRNYANRTTGTSPVTERTTESPTLDIPAVPHEDGTVRSR